MQTNCIGSRGGVIPNGQTKTLVVKVFVPIFPQTRIVFSTGGMSAPPQRLNQRDLFSGVRFVVSPADKKPGTMLKQVQTQKQQHTILPQQIELLNLFHLNTLELDQRIQDELSENPALEEQSTGDDTPADKFSKESVQDFQNWEEYGYDDIPDYKTEYNNYINTEKVPEKPIAEVTDFRE
jgi:hypothetical protein